MNVAVVGLGLIGGSVGLAAGARGDRVSGYDADAEARAQAAELGAAGAVHETLEAAVAEAEITFVCGPVARLPELVAQSLAAAPEGSIVTDVGSTKARLVRAAESHPRFVGGHPVCGSEARGVASARADLFDGATWFLTPDAGTDPVAHRAVHGFVSGLGARPVAIDAEAHDRLVAITSHLPHAIANVLVNQAGSGRVDGHDPLAAVGGSFRDMTRVAGANPRIWVDIFLDNRGSVLEVLQEHGRRIDELTRALEREDAGFLARWIAEASGHRRRLLADRLRGRSRGALPRPRAPARPARRDLRDHPGAGRRGDQHRGLRAAPPVRRPRRHGGHPGCRRGAGAAGGRPARRTGLWRGGEPGGGRVNETGSLRVSPAGALLGELTVPGDKSVSHRAVMLGALAEEMVTVDGFGASADTLATIDAFRRMGVASTIRNPGTWSSRASGCAGCEPPDGPIDVGNAGTLIRLLPGILAGQQGEFVLDGDESIRSRPMQRIAVPLAEMGVDIQTTDGHPPVTVRGGGGRADRPTGRRSPRPRSSRACSWPACHASGG